MTIAAALGFYAEFFQAEIFDIADDADRGDDALDGKRLRAAFAVVDGRGDAVIFLVQLRHLGAGENFDALLLKTLAREGGDLGIFRRQDLRQNLDNRHVSAQRAVERGEFDADRARADDEQRLRHAVRNHGLEIGPDEFLVRLDTGKDARARAGRDDDVLGLVGAGAERAFRVLRSCRAFTVTFPGASIAASPQITATLFFFIRKPTPSLRRLATARERFTTADGS